MYGERDGGEQEQNTDDNLYEHSGFRLPHTRNALALGGLLSYLHETQKSDPHFTQVTICFFMV